MVSHRRFVYLLLPSLILKLSVLIENHAILHGHVSTFAISKIDSIRKFIPNLPLASRNHLLGFVRRSKIQVTQVQLYSGLPTNPHFALPIGAGGICFWRADELLRGSSDFARE